MNYAGVLRMKEINNIQLKGCSDPVEDIPDDHLAILAYRDGGTLSGVQPFYGLAYRDYLIRKIKRLPAKGDMLPYRTTFKALAEGPMVNEWKAGTFMYEGYGPDDDGFVYRLVMIDPDKIDYAEKWESVEGVLAMPSTKNYIQWYKEGHLPLPISVIYNQPSKTYMSTNRRRLLAARAAGIKRIPAWVELGKYSSLAEKSV
jgi:hypothetical protein